MIGLNYNGDPMLIKEISNFVLPDFPRKFENCPSGMRYVAALGGKIIQDPVQIGGMIQQIYLPHFDDHHFIAFFRGLAIILKSHKLFGVCISISSAKNLYQSADTLQATL